MTKIHMANSTLQDNGWGPQLLCSVFGFVPGPDAPERRSAVPPRLPLQAWHLLSFRAGRRRQGASRHRARAAHSHHGGRRPPGRAGPEPLVPHVGHAGLDDGVATRCDRLIDARGGAVNFRDLGGTPPWTGSAPAGASLFRADGLGELTEADLSVLRDARHPDGHRPALGVRARTQPLRRRRPPGRVPPLPLHRGTARRPGVRPAARAARLAVPGDPARRRARRSSPPSTSCRHPMRCPPCSTAPPARTAPGVSRALVLSLLGVDEPTVVADYALERRGHAASAGQAHRSSTPRAARRSRTSTRSSRPTPPRWSCCSTTCGRSTDRSSAYVAGLGARAGSDRGAAWRPARAAALRA